VIRGAEQPAADSSRRLDRDALPSDTIALARFLIGKTLVHEVGEARLGGRIVETEAYLTGDAASHAFRGETRRNRSMFLERGHAYVYIAYGCWPVLNVTSEAAGIGTAVLVRALEPLQGIEQMQLGRKPARLVDLTRGPGRLAAAMRITMAHDGVDLCGTGALWLGTPVREPDAIGISTRIGISKDADRPLRFFERGSRYVSGPRHLLSNAGAAKLER
jgi:DNA-3-methyladenine glycosylase